MNRQINIEVEGSELALKNSHGDIVIIPKKNRVEVEGMIKDKCWNCIDTFVETLPIMADYAEDGSLIPDWDKVKSTLNPYNWGVDDYSTENNFNSAYSKARKNEQKEFIYKNKRYNTNYKGTPQQQLEETGITNAEINAIKTANTVSNMYGNLSGYISGTKDSNLKESNYKPTVLSNKKYYKWNENTKINEPYIPVQKYYTREGMKNDVYNDLVSEKVMKDYNHTNEFDDIHTALLSNGTDRKNNAATSFPKNKAGYKGMYNLGHGSIKGELNLGRYITDAGEDENGKYISFNDRYDWNGVETGGKYPEYNEKAINFYDRIYENEWHKLQNKEYSDKELSKLDINKRNFDVKSLQKTLSNNGYKLPNSIKENGSFDGVWGGETKQALLEYQTKNKKQNEL